MIVNARNPGSITALSRKSGVSPDETASLYNAIHTIGESGHHLLELINDILDLAKIEAGYMDLNINFIQVEALCQSSIRMIKELAQKKSLNVSFEMEEGATTISGDERKLKQSLVNLLSNAVKFTFSQS